MPITRGRSMYATGSCKKVAGAGTHEKLLATLEMERSADGSPRIVKSLAGQNVTVEIEVDFTPQTYEGFTFIEVSGTVSVKEGGTVAATGTIEGLDFNATDKGWAVDIAWGNGFRGFLHVLPTGTNVVIGYKL